MKTFLIHPTPNNNVKALANGLLETGTLSGFYTTIATFPCTFLSYLSLLPPFSDLNRRKLNPSLKLFTRTFPTIELGRQLATKMGVSSLIAHEKGIFCVDAVIHHLDLAVSKLIPESFEKGLTTVYGYEDGALFSFVSAKQLGIKCVYELPIAYWETSRKLLTEEAHRLPHWSITLGGGNKDSLTKLERKRQELELADTVVVPSQFVFNSLPQWALRKKIIVAPFGTPDNVGRKLSERLYTHPDKPLRVLFVGSMGQRKGLGDLFTAFNLLSRSDIELIVLGSLLAPLEFYRQQLPTFIYEPGRSNEQVLALMRTCDVFCLPSIVEGRALVLQEAMSQGLPLIITPNTGGEDLILEGETGFLVPIRSPEMIANKLVWFLTNREKIPEMGRSAQKHAMNYTWKRYSDTIIRAISS